MTTGAESPGQPSLLQRLTERAATIAAIGDAPGHTDRTDDESLLAGVAPLFDILRHPRSTAPLRLALHAPPGGGKSTALRWLAQSLTKLQDDQNAGKDAPRITTVEFNASSFAQPEEARRGLLAEIILATTGVATAGADAVRRTINDFGPYFGRSFVLALASQKLDSGAPIGAKEKAELASLESALDEFPAHAEPESLSLSVFQTRFAKALQRNLHGDTRLVVCIDDLDRCSTAVRNAVLETIRLQLRLPQVFVVVATSEQTPATHATSQNGHAVDPAFFHARCDMTADEAALLAFSERELRSRWPADTWTALADDTRALFARLALEFSAPAPLALKQFWNRGLLAVNAADPEANASFRAQIAAFLLREVLGKRHQFATLVDQHFGVEFLAALARAAQAHPTERPHFEISRANLALSPREKGIASDPPLWEVRLSGGKVDAWREVAARLATHPRAASLAQIARDADILDLLRLDAAKPLQREIESRPIGKLRQLEATIIAEAARRNAPTTDAAPDVEQIEVLDLAGLELTSLRPLRNFVNLVQLNAARTLITDLAGVGNLHRLTSLDVHETGISDIAPLRSLARLSALNIADTRVSNIAPLADAGELQELNASRTLVHDIAPIAGLQNLVNLALAGTRVNDATPLATFASLVSLDLHGTGIEDTIPLASLKNLLQLDLSDTSVEFVAPIARLHALQSLILSNTRVSDLSRLTTLKELQCLDVGDTQISDIAPLEEMAGLVALELANLPLQSCKPLSSLIDLRMLSLAGTKISDLAPIGKLRHLVTLDIRNVPAQDVEPLQGCLSLKRLIVSESQLDASTKAKLISRNPRLEIVEK